MKRRSALQTLAVAPALTAQELAVSNPESVAEPRLHFFSAAEMTKLKNFSAQIVPAIGKRPGAVESGAPEFLDFLLSKSSAADQRLYRQGLAAVSDLKLLEKPWTYQEPTDLPSRFVRRLKEDVLRATFNSQKWIASSGRRGGGTNYYWKPLD